MYLAAQEVPEIAGQLQIGLCTLYMWIKKDVQKLNVSREKIVEKK